MAPNVLTAPSFLPQKEKDARCILLLPLYYINNSPPIRNLISASCAEK